MLEKHRKFRPWVKKVMPTIYDDSLTYYELLTKVVGFLNELFDQSNEIIDYIDYLQKENDGDFQKIRLDMQDFEQQTLQDIATYKLETVAQINALKTKFEEVKLWFEHTALPESIEAKLDEMLNDGTLADVINNDVFNMKLDTTTFNQKMQTVDSELERNKSRIEELATNVMDYGAKGDGMTDDTNAIMQFFEDIPNGSKVVFPQKKQFKIILPLNLIGKKDIILDWNNSKLLYAGTSNLDNNNGTSRFYGGINVRGRLLESTTTNVIGIVKNEGIIDKEFYINGDNFKGLVNPFTQISKIVTENETIGNTIKKGDYVSVNIKNYTGYNWNKNYGDNPSLLNVVARVIYVEGGNIYIDVNTELEFDQTKVNGTITKVEMSENITIENLVFEDVNDTPIPEISDNSQRDSWVGGISAQYVSHFTLNNYKCSRHRFPALMMRSVYNPNINNFVASYPRTVMAGCGYGMQIGSSVHGHISNVRGYGLRHLVDFSSSGHMIVENAKMPNDWHGAMDCHGLGEFDITYRDCVGNFLAGNGINEFPDMVGHISLINCKGSLQMAWAKKIHADNSTLFIDSVRMVRTPNISVTNSTILFKRTRFNFVAVPRGVYNDTIFYWHNNELIITELNNPWQEWTTKLFEIDCFKKVEISSTPYVKNMRNDVMNIYIAKATTVTIENNKFTNLGFVLTNVISLEDSTIVANNSMQAGVLRLLNNDINENLNLADSKNFFIISDVDDITSYLIILQNTTFYSDGKTRWLRLSVNAFNVNIIAENNVFRGRVGALYTAGTKLPNFIGRENNIDLSSTDEPTRLKNYEVKNIGLNIPAGWGEYQYSFTPEKVQPDNAYRVMASPEWNIGTWWIPSETKTRTGFVIKFATPPTSESKITLDVLRY